MKRFVLLLCAVVALPCLGRGDVLPLDAAVAGRSERWFRRTDPARFFASEAGRGRVYFIGVYDPADGTDSPAPGISRRDPGFRVSRTVFVPRGNTLSPARNQRFEASVREFARRYNPLVLAYLKGHPADK